jgi:small-conductance mechanosensitive channel
MIVLIALLFGVYYGMTQAPVGEQTVEIAQRIHKILVVLLVTFVIARVLTGLLKAYSHREESSKSSLSLFKSIINIIVYTLGLLVMLSSFGISIAPILTALGVGGLAVALALQDTLSNLFAGIQITLTRTIKPGDYIHLTTGEEGTVLDITWRSTTLLTQSDNMTVIPNSKLATSIITNYSLPKRNLSISVPVGISYSSDLEKIEQITLEIGETLMRENGIETKPVFRYKEFGTSTINFSLSMDINEFSLQYVLRHEFIKRLYKRFKSEGIEIPYPTTSVYLKKEN